MAEISPAAFYDQRFQLPGAKGTRKVEREGQTKRRVGVYPSADRIILLGKKSTEFFGQSIRQRLQTCRPTTAIGIVPAMQLFGEFQQPRPAVGALERCAI